MTKFNLHPEASRRSLRNVFGAAALVAVGMFIGSNSTMPEIAWSQIITTPQPQHMLSGGQMSVAQSWQRASSRSNLDRGIWEKRSLRGYSMTQLMRLTACNISRAGA